MFELRILSEFAAAHRLREYGGDCEALHGHNWKVEVTVSGRELADNGLLMDFRLIKEAAGQAVGSLDHKFLNELEPFHKQNPSSENIARYLFRFVAARLNSEKVRVSRVTAWESDSASASYSEP